MSSKSALTKSEDEIFDRYRQLYPTQPILPDGSPSPADYLKTDNFKVLFLMKEGNDKDGCWAKEKGFDLRHLAHSGGRFASWHNLATWVAFAQRLPVSAEKRRSQEWRAAQLRKAIFVNAKKIPGGSTSRTKEIHVFARKHQDLLKDQLQLYRPHVTLACGHRLFDILESTFQAERQRPENLGFTGRNGFLFFRDAAMGTVIDFYHPESRHRGGWQKLASYLDENLRYHFPLRYA
jgi:hypothetical protein